MREIRIVRDLLLIVAGVLCFAASPAGARIHHGGATGVVTAPVLQNQAVSFGGDTPTSRGGVWLNSMDNSQWGTATSGLDIETTVGTPCVSYSQTQTGGTAGHFTVISANTPVGSTALTPRPTSAGQAAHLNGGPYIFSTTCKDASGNTSNTATLTYNIVAKAATLGTNDASTGIVQAGFGATSGYQILIATGFQRPGSRTGIQNVPCVVLCTVAPADPLRPALQINIELSGTTSNMDVNGLTFTGDLATIGGNANASILVTTTASNIQAHNNTTYFTPALLSHVSTSGWNFARLQGPGTTLDGNTCYNCQSGFLLENGAANTTITNNNIRGWTSDCVFMYNGANLVFTDNLCASPFVANVGIHVDSFQISGNGTPPGMTIKRNMFVTADGNSIGQGAIFNLGVLNLMGYISDGAGSTNPGKVITLTTGNWGGQIGAVTGSQLYSPGLLLGSDNAIIGSGVTTNGTTANLNLASNMSIGSAASPVPFYSYGLKDLVMDGNIVQFATTNGYDIGYEQGTSSMSHFGYASQIPGAPYATNFTGTITGTTNLSATSVSGIVGIENGSAINFPGCTGCSTSAGVKVTGTNCPNGGGPCSFTLSVAQTNVGPIAMTSTPAAPWIGTNPALIKQENSNTAAFHGGTFARSLGWSQSGIAANPGPGFPANTTDTNVFDGHVTSGVSAFANGDPQTQAQAIYTAGAPFRSNAQVRADYCHIWLPKVGGPLDLGSGVYAGPVKLSGGVGVWFDGTPIPGCT